MNNLDALFWEKKYTDESTGWDIGAVSTPLKTYFDQLTNKNISILIPGAGNAYEAEYLHKLGFDNVHIIDWAQSALNNIKLRVPSFPKEHLFQVDFFAHECTYDLIIEQTFFCAISPALRKQYVNKMYEMLKPNGKLVGVLFNIQLNDNHPPFGGCKEDYLSLFEEKFHIKMMDTAYNSITPRQNNELFIILEKKPVH